MNAQDVAGLVERLNAEGFTSPDRTWLQGPTRKVVDVILASLSGQEAVYIPQVVQYPDSGESELVLTDEFHTYGEDATVTVVRDAENRIAGFRWPTAAIPNAGPKRAAPQPASLPAGVGEAVKPLVPNERLEQMIRTADPTHPEAHDMAVELILHRRAMLAASSTPETAAPEGEQR